MYIIRFYELLRVFLFLIENWIEELKVRNIKKMSERKRTFLIVYDGWEKF